ncbi:hypothetical protein [Ornithobacterium rhinotracheale]|uniref:hypothetical protein n=1 Tax=Ornithobacterium rhinotracheale TaxID=28251 RepID=UPI001FF0F1C9|nr:hypothetical protein [Ornithobacterium rhinotracheale]MCK0199199.1 hypothetical protein [Ornithobacterium rhinotracheale]MCK0200287.1 hypothetical protein [Ornithobacterium rhinotracheale]
MTKKAKKLLKKLHKELNKQEACNTYFLIEDANTGALKPVQCYSHKELLDKEEKKAFAMKAKQIAQQLRHKVRSERKELNRLKYHEAITIGLWVIDRNPKEVTHKWIKENAYQIEAIQTAPECID